MNRLKCVATGLKCFTGVGGCVFAAGFYTRFFLWFFLFCWTWFCSVGRFFKFFVFWLVFEVVVAARVFKFFSLVLYLFQCF